MVTPAHVVEPRLCGLGARYLDLGACYDPEIMAQNRAALEDARAKNAAGYPLCYAALRCAGAAAEGLRQIAGPVLPKTAREELSDLLPPLSPAARSGRRLRRWITALTPKGALCLPPSCQTLLMLRDSYGLLPQVLCSFAARFLAAGFDCAEAYDPLEPMSLQALLVPALSLGIVRSSRLFPFSDAAPVLDADALTAQNLSYEAEQQLQAFERLRADAVQTALCHLKTAKRHHDALEAACRPAVDFSVVDRAAEEACHLI